MENIQLYSVSQAASYKALYLLHKLHGVEKTRGIAIYSELEREIQKGGKKKRQNQELINKRERSPENQRRKETERSNKETKK